jgi:hypothetical protein
MTKSDPALAMISVIAGDGKTHHGPQITSPALIRLFIEGFIEYITYYLLYQRSSPYPNCA